MVLVLKGMKSHGRMPEVSHNEIIEGQPHSVPYGSNLPKSPKGTNIVVIVNE